MELANAVNASNFHDACDLLLRVYGGEDSDSLDNDVRDFLREHGYLED